MKTTQLEADAPDTSTPSDSCTREVRVGPDDVATPKRRLPTAVRVLLGIPLMFLATYAPMLPVLLPGGAEFTYRDHPDVIAVPIVVGVCGLATFAAVVLVRLMMRFVDRRPLRDAGLVLTRRTLPSLGLGLLVTVVAGLATALAVEATGVLQPSPAAAAADGQALWVVTAVALAQAFLLQGIPEELIWRGYVLQTLRTRPWVSVLISATVFALPHLRSQGGQEGALDHVLYLAMPFGFALLAGALVIRTGSVWSAVGVHGGFHVALTVATLAFGVGTGSPLWLALGVVFTALGVAFLRTRPARVHAAGTDTIG